MYCYDVCLCVGVCTVFLGRPGRTGWCPLTFCKHYLRLGASTSRWLTRWDSTEISSLCWNIKLVSPRQHTTTFCCIKTKNTTFSNVIMLLYVSLKLVRSHISAEERRELYLYLCLYMWLSCPELIWFGDFFVVGCYWRVGGMRTHITFVAFEHRKYALPLFLYPFLPSGKTEMILFDFC